MESLTDELELIEPLVSEEEPLVFNIPNDYCLSCGLSAEVGYKYIYAVCIYDSKRCVKRHTTTYY